MLALCEQSARPAGFARAQLIATRAGEPLYLACGCAVAERIDRMAAVGMAVPGPS
ncbi:hypothetical protein [Sphingomonas bacterium]|uniref:hypothetical protein n=1 Tax=Sphingomonas bacterium TaxID=1895847 RepID=UPI00262A8C83|nr:hypothetical protein [Sphingomonas bacterium]